MTSPLLYARSARGRRAGRLFLLGGLVLLLVGASLAAPNHPSMAFAGRTASTVGGPGGGGTGKITNVTVNLTDAPAYSPSSVNAPAGGVVAFQLVNQGTLNHTFTVANVSGFVFAPTISPSALSAWFAANGSLADVLLGPGQTDYVNLSIPSADSGDSFEFLSTIPYQFQAGMHGFLNVSGGSSGPGVVENVATNDQLRFVPDALEVNATSFPVTIDVQVTNQGSNAHTFTVEGQSNNTLLPGNFSAYFTAHPPLANVALGSAGAVVWANFTILKPGVFEYICEVPGHFVNGMFGFLYVGVAPPEAAAGPSTAIVQEGVLIGAGSLLGVGALFALAATLSGRFPRAPRPPAHP